MANCEFNTKHAVDFLLLNMVNYFLDSGHSVQLNQTSTILDNDAKITAGTFWLAISKYFHSQFYLECRTWGRAPNGPSRNAIYRYVISHSREKFPYIHPSAIRSLLKLIIKKIIKQKNTEAIYKRSCAIIH